MKWNELLYVLIFSVVVTSITMLIDVYDHIFRFTRPFEAYQLDNIVVFLPFSLLLGMMWFSYRRGREAKQELTARRKVEEKMLIYQEQLRALVSELLLTEERERRRLATDLHDSICQHLAVAKLKTAALQHSSSSASLTEELEKIGSILADGLRQARSLVFELSPPELHELGLEVALKSLVKQVKQQHGISVELVEDEQPKPLKEHIAVFCFRAVQELMINVVKHAHARNVCVSIARDGDHVRLTVADDGTGFPSQTSSCGGDRAKGFGLFSISERLHHLGGHLKVESEPGQGTRVIVTVPLGSSPTRSSLCKLVLPQ